MTTAPKRQPIPFGKYLLLDRVNIGGMAEVWRGKMFGAGGFERLVAIKRILPSIAEDEEFITMFIDEAKISVQLTHANIAQIYELGNIQNNYFIAMEYIPGKDLRAIFERCRKKGEPAPIPLSCYVIAKLCEGLDYAHRKKDGMGRDMNIVHRDVSPQNVLVSYEGEVKVIDFGIAKAANKATKTQAGILKGKFGYMSPEQIRGLGLDRRSDVFAIGICLYEMLTGERLFVGDSDFSVLEKVRKAEIIPPSTYNRRIPEALEKIVLKSLSREVETRYQYANELADDLQRFLITSDSIFSRKDLMAYMKATFAEEVEREKIRLQEYAEIKAPEGMSAAAEMGFGGSPAPARTPSMPSMPAVSGVQAGPGAMARPTLAGNPPGASQPRSLAAAAAAAISESGGGLPPGPTQPLVKRTPSLTNLPKLTAAAPLTAQQLDDGGGATQINDGASPLDSGPQKFDQKFKDAPEPATMPGQLPASLQALIPQPPAPAPTPRTPAPLGGAPARASGSNMPAARPSNPNLARPSGPRAQPPVLGDDRPKTRMDRPASPLVEPANGASGHEAPRLADGHEAPRTRKTARPASSDGGSKFKVLAAVGALAAIVAAGALVIFFRPPPEGFVVIDVTDANAREKARVNLNGEQLPPPSGWPLLQKTKAGNAVVMVTADGYKPFVASVEVKEGAHPTTVNADLRPVIEEADLVVITEPDTAEVVLNGQVVKALGKLDVYAGKVPVGAAQKLEVRAAGYRTEVQNVTADDPHSPRRVMVRLKPADFQVSVSSDPSGAEIVVEGKTLAVTPASVKLPAGAKSFVLRKKCFDPAEVPVQPPSDLGASLSVNRALKKQPNCR